MSAEGMGLMHREEGPEKPLLLMLSHCVPQATGDADRARAWQLLRLASQTHQVLLAAVIDGPVNLSQWSAVQAHAQRIVIEKGALAPRWIGRGIALAHEPAGERFRFDRALGAAVDVWQSDFQFDAVLCTHPALWRQAQQTEASTRICDLHASRSLLHRHMGRAQAIVARWWHKRQAQLHQFVELEIAGQCDTMTVANPESAHALMTEPCRTVVLPDAIDLDYFDADSQKAQANGAQGKQRLVFHADRSSMLHGRTLDWFRRDIWPRVEQAVSGVEFSCSGRSPLSSTPHDLSDASVVVSPIAEPDLARWPILQTLAMRRPVIVPREGADEMGLRHGENALLSRNDRDWVDHCIESLRSAKIRLDLARGGRSHVEKNFPIRTGLLPLRALAASQALPAKRAA